MPYAATQMDLRLSDYISQRKTYITDIAYMQNLKWYKWIYLQKQKQTLRLREWTYGYQWVRVEGKDRQGIWDWQEHTAMFKKKKPFHEKKNQSINVTRKKSPDPDGSQDNSSKCLKNQRQFYTTSSENR